ncbi:MAG: type I-E CRISPR-associated endonuclease Cas1e [Acidobacteriota bacterium]
MLKGRLGLESAKIPHADRHGLLWLSKGKLWVENGTLRFLTAGSEDLPPGEYAIPFQMLSCLLLEPGVSVSHDALRLLARHGVGMVATGRGGVRFYASLPAGPETSARARRHARLWSDPDARIQVARRMFAMRLGEILAPRDLNALRGLEGARMKATYRRLAEQYGIRWHGRRYDRNRPETADLPNQAINHASSALEGAALVAVAAAGAIPQLGFIHEEAGHAFALDVSDLFRDSVLIPVAFEAVQRFRDDERRSLERHVRSLAGERFRKEKVVAAMIERIKGLIDADDDRRDA